MIRALQQIISDLARDNVTRGVQKAINAMAAHIAESSHYNQKDRAFAQKVWEASGRPYSGFVGNMKKLLAEYEASK